MKPFILSILFLAILQTSFAQKYEYDRSGKSITDTLPKSPNDDIKVIIAEDGEENALEKTILNGSRTANFESTNLDSNYIYHKVGQGEDITYIVDLYQICAPCFAEWNNFKLEYREFPIAVEKGQKEPKLKMIPISSKEMMFGDLILFEIFEGEYLKVALKKEYEKGIPLDFQLRRFYKNFSYPTYLKDVASDYGVSINNLRYLNNLDRDTFYVGDMVLFLGFIHYKYACPCLENQN
ncbi:hypothetical protein ACE193_13420 [Bernardetia sp. OM2101]|uniref:hypothetical protein n=1 Tax=Bernardetia sp. OM2101 TaxID=3344876 RepID=UPI0035D06241